eukprot:COSAG06_NODE_4899_length_3874_cov_1.540662_3_plen_298_part_00
MPSCLALDACARAVLCPQSQTPPTQTAPVPFWRERTAQPIATPRGGSGGGKRPVRYMGWRPGETYDLSDVKHSERSINRPMTASADFIPPVEERAAIRGCLQKSSGYRGHIPRRFDVALTQPGGRGDIDQTYIRHHPGRVGHPDMPDTSLEPHVPSREHRTIEKDSSKLVHRVRPEVRHMFTETARAAPRGTREGVGMGYGGHVPKLFGGMKTSPGVNPSLLNGPGLCEQPRVDVRLPLVAWLRLAVPRSALPRRVSASGSVRSTRADTILLCVRVWPAAVREVHAPGLTQRANRAR